MRESIDMEAKKSQLDRFKEAARELRADDDEAKFNEKLGKLVKQKPSDKSGADKEKTDGE